MNFKLLIKKKWKQIPFKYQLYIYPIFSKIYYFYCLILSSQYSFKDVGIIKVPFFSKPYLKHSFSQIGEDIVLDRIITAVLRWDIHKPGIYVDVGAYHPIIDSVTYILYRRKWKGIVFDPSTQSKKLFKYWRPKDIFVNALVGEKKKDIVEYYVPKNSFSDLNLTNTKYVGNSKNYNSKKIRQVNINEELEKLQINSIDFINIDAEGSEMEILKTFNFKKFNPAIISVEIHGNDIIKNTNHELSKLIISNGYKLVACNVITYFYCKDSLIN